MVVLAAQSPEEDSQMVLFFCVHITIAHSLVVVFFMGKKSRGERFFLKKKKKEKEKLIGVKMPFNSKISLNIL